MNDNLKIIYTSIRNQKYIGSFTNKEIEIIKNNIIDNFRTLNLFSGKSIIGIERIDYYCKEATKNIDVFKYLNDLDYTYFTDIIIDAPYNKKFANKYKIYGNTSKQFIIFANAKKTSELFHLISEKINPIQLIIKSYNYYIPKHYKLHKGYLCYNGGYRKPTILLILRRNKDIIYHSNKNNK
jgi:hypothetical protein